MEIIPGVFSDEGLNIFSTVLKAVSYFIPLFLIWLGWQLWVRHRNDEWISTLDWVMLEIRVPRDVFKSPLAMEMALGNALFQGGGVGTRYNRYWKGRVLVWFSLEIVSIEGDIHFYIRTPKQFRNIIESQIYAQYPRAEIFQVDDYVLPVVKSMYEEEWSMWGCEFKLKKPDAYPIKTYVDYGLDKSVTSIEDQEAIIDPIVSQLEWMGTMKKDEHFWLQIPVRVSKNGYTNHKGLFPKAIDWKDKANDEIKKIREKYEGGEDALEALGKKIKMSKAEQEAISAIERSLDKPVFDVGVRAIYLAKKDAFKSEHINGLTGIMRPYNSNNLNNFGVTNDTDFANPWEDISGNKKVEKKKAMLEAYINRGYFYAPYKKEYFGLTAEELATIYHFPGRVSATPTFKRIESKKSEPPVNLPV